MTLPFIDIEAIAGVINWPNFDTVVSQGIRDLRIGRGVRRRDGQEHSQNTHGIFQLSPLPHWGWLTAAQKQLQ